MNEESARASSSGGDLELEDNAMETEFSKDGDDEEGSDEEENYNPTRDDLERETMSPKYEQHIVELEDNLEAPSATIDIRILNDIRCAAHVVQLGLNDFVKKYRTDIDYLTDAVKITRRRFEHMNRADMPPKPTLANATRWSSTYKMASLRTID